MTNIFKNMKKSETYKMTELKCPKCGSENFIFLDYRKVYYMCLISPIINGKIDLSKEEMEYEGNLGKCEIRCKNCDFLLNEEEMIQFFPEVHRDVSIPEKFKYRKIKGE